MSKPVYGDSVLLETFRLIKMAQIFRQAQLEYVACRTEDKTDPYRRNRQTKTT